MYSVYIYIYTHLYYQYININEVVYIYNITHTSNSDPNVQPSLLLASESFHDATGTPSEQWNLTGLPSMAGLLFEEVGTSRFAAKARMHQCHALVTMLKDDATI